METPDQSKLIQISSDGPSVNQKFLIIIVEHHDEEDHLLLIDNRTCGLHAIQGSLKN